MVLALPRFFAKVLGVNAGGTSGAAGLGATAKAGGSVRAFVSDFRKYLAAGFRSSRTFRRFSTSRRWARKREDLSKDTNDAGADDGGD